MAWTSHEREREWRREYQATRRATSAGREEDRAFARAYHHKYREKNLEKMRQRYAADKEKRSNHMRVLRASQRARKLGGEDTLTLDEWFEIRTAYEDKCAYCFEPFSDLEHVVALSDGGSNTRENVVPACRLCNTTKHNRRLVPHIASRFWPPSEHLLA